MTTPKSFLFAMVDGGGTVPPELSVARRLVARGHDVTVLTENSIEIDVRATGATFRPWLQAPNRASHRPEDDPYRDWECKNPLRLLARMLDKALASPAPLYAADVDDAVAQHRPDVVVCSQFAIGAMVAAESAGIPFVVLMPNVYVLPAEGMPPFGMGFRPARGRTGRARDRCMLGLTARLWDKGLDRLNALRVRRGLQPVEHFWQQLDGAARQFVMTSPSFDFPARFPDNVEYVGAELGDPDWTEPWQAPAGDEPLVLVAMSSTFQDHVESLQRIADALGSLPVRAVLTTGPAIDPSAIRAPEGVTVVASAPHSQVLQRAAAVVTHGGHGTVVKTLAAGVPMLVMPHGRDQGDNATRVVMRGAGLKLKKNASRDKIAAAVRQLLEDPSYRERAARLGTEIRRDAASNAVIVELERLPIRSVDVVADA